MKELKVGDRVYVIDNYGRIRAVRTIKKITKTRATCGYYNYRKEISERGTVFIKGQGDWVMLSGHLETEELKIKLIKQKKCDWFNTTKFSEEDQIKIYDLFH